MKRANSNHLRYKSSSLFEEMNYYLEKMINLIKSVGVGRLENKVSKIKV
jgi:hypothetical protein